MAENKHRGPTLDSFLEEEGVLAEFQAKAIKEVIAWQLAEAMRERKLSKKRLALLMHTSRGQYIERTQIYAKRRQPRSGVGKHLFIAHR